MALEVFVRLYQPLKPTVETHSFVVGSYQGGESDILGLVMVDRGKTCLRDLRKLIEETRRGKTAFRSRMFNDIVYFFNESPNIHGLPEGMRRKYRFAIAPKRAPAYEDSKEQSEHPTVVPLDRETEMVADQVLPRYLEKQTVLLVQELWIGPGCGEICVYRDCGKCASWKAEADATLAAGGEIPVTNHL